MNSKKKKAYRTFARIMFVLYLVLIVYVMFVSEELGRGVQRDEFRYNLVLFDEIKRFWYYRESLGIKSVLVNILGNVVTFMPFGFILPMLTKKKIFKNIITVTFFTFIFSLLIESTQLYLRIGAFDVDDLFLNTLGGFTGCLIYHIFNTIRVCMSRSKKGKRK